MPIWTAPNDDVLFLLEDVLKIHDLKSLRPYADISSDLLRTIVDEAGKFCENELLPLNAQGDMEGCVRDAQGNVTTPSGFKQAYQAFCDAGWPSLSCATEYGGQGLPQLLKAVLNEFVSASNLSFGLYPGLTHSAVVALEAHASDALKKKYLPNLASGKWTGTMCLTEPHAGTDLSLLRTMATQADTGEWHVRGTKIFISAGEHDLAENIIHLVLARTPGAPSGIAGISLFLVPKFIDNKRNAVTCGGIEHKMGIKASATCTMNFDGAVGWLVGEIGGGLRAMFTMMNEARISVGIQGLGIADISLQNAVAYAKSRLQGRSLKMAASPETEADPIIVHPDVRRMLMTMRALTEGGRALAYTISLELDREAHHPDAEQRKAAGRFVALMTPVVKAFLTDTGTEVANLAVQVYGGHGYIRDNGIEQFVRDARITQIYEGTNGIQALDLVGRKMSREYGRLLREFFHPVSSAILAAKAVPSLASMADSLAVAFAKLQAVSMMMATRGTANPDEAAAGATEYLRFFALVAVGHLWLKMAAVADEALRDPTPLSAARTAFLRDKIAMANFYMKKILPQVSGLNLSIAAGVAPVMAVANW